MVEIVQTKTFSGWLNGLRDRRAKARILTRILRLSNGNPGDVRPVGEGISEMRLTYGPGYRLYYKAMGELVAILLCGGDKSSQAADIARAKALAAELENDTT